VNAKSFRDKVVAQDQQGKIAHEDAGRLIAGADEAIACIRGYGCRVTTLRPRRVRRHFVASAPE